jgi:hypothetical protein
LAVQQDFSHIRVPDGIDGGHHQIEVIDVFIISLIKLEYINSEAFFIHGSKPTSAASI